MGGTEREREERFEHERGHKEGLSSFQETRSPFKKDLHESESCFIKLQFTARKQQMV